MDKNTSNRKRRPAELTEKRITAIIARLADNKRIRRALPVWGRVHIDRQLPFLCVYRRPVGRMDSGTDRLISSGAAYLNAPGERRFHQSLMRLLEQLAALMTDRFGAYLILEVWEEDRVVESTAEQPTRPGFCLYHPPTIEITSTIKAFQGGLSAVKSQKQKADVTTIAARRISPPGLAPLLPVKRLQTLGIYLLGLEVKPIFVNAKTKDVYPLLLRSIRRQLSPVLNRAFYNFAREHTTHRPPHYHALGRRAMVKAVWEVDRRLAAVSSSFDFLYQVTPVNTEKAWRTFQRSRFETKPVFLYRPHSIDPGLLKRALYDIRVERVEDPTLMHLFLDKQMELDRQLTMISDLGTKRFLYGSLQLHGDVASSLVKVAREILDRTPSRSRKAKQGGALTASEFADLARAEVAWYAQRYPEFKASVQVSDEMYSGLLVSRSRLLIGKKTRIPKHRAEALLQHEVGTHLLTYFNGQAQPFKMLYTGLPGYDGLQEGLAVLSEYLVDGLTAERLRVLAARVLAARALIDGGSFVDVFRLLERVYKFSQLSAYTVTMRVFRGGGLLKDAVYLRGLLDILRYLANGKKFDILFAGKIAQDHIGVIEELLLRKILKPPPLHPRYLEKQGTQMQFEKIQNGITILDLLEK